MTEQEFWRFLEKAWEKGRAAQVSGTIDSPVAGVQTAGEYIGGHALLPRDYDKIPQELIVKMSKLLFKKGVRHKTKEAVMMILAHQESLEALIALEKYNKQPDKELKIFAEIALSESEMWNDKGEWVEINLSKKTLQRTQ